MRNYRFARYPACIACTVPYLLESALGFDGADTDSRAVFRNPGVIVISPMANSAAVLRICRLVYEVSVANQKYYIIYFSYSSTSYTAYLSS